MVKCGVGGAASFWFKEDFQIVSKILNFCVCLFLVFEACPGLKGLFSK